MTLWQVALTGPVFMAFAALFYSALMRWTRSISDAAAGACILAAVALSVVATWLLIGDMDLTGAIFAAPVPSDGS